MHQAQTGRSLTALQAARFDADSSEYEAWREQRLSRAAMQQQACIDVPLDALLATTTNSQPPSQTTQNSSQLNDACKHLCEAVHSHGYAIYRFCDTHRQAAPGQSVGSLTLARSQAAACALALHLGLTTTDDGVIRDAGQLSLLRDLSNTPHGRFIPYTSKAMNWHTDGYYNRLDRTVRSFTLHCVQAASTGGALTVIDPELVLIALLDKQPEIVQALARPDAMLLPANKDDQGHDRPARSVPVFFTHSDGTLGMRFTTRTENIQWSSVETAQAAKHAAKMIEQCQQWQMEITLQPGQGIITRNVLHRRSAFVDAADSAGRQMLRGRYLQAVTTAGGSDAVYQ